MPFTCSVPNCRGNYRGGPKVSVFLFPKDQVLCNKWLSAIKRDNFTPSSSSRVCELHFREDEIERSTKFYDLTGEALDISLKVPRLKKDTIPSKFPTCSKYLFSSDQPKRESPERKKQRIENIALHKAILESIESSASFSEAQSLNTLDDIDIKFKNRNIGSWTLTRSLNYICFLYLKETPPTTVPCTASIDENLLLNLYYYNTKISSVRLQTGSITFPIKVSTVNFLETILQESIIFLERKAEDTSVKDKCNMAMNILDSLATQMPEKNGTIKFLQEQFKLLTFSKQAARYSWETILFCSLLHAISPHAYKFLRSANFLTLPCSNTVKKLCNNPITEPGLEQNNNFLHYVSEKTELLEDKDKLITLMIDEIHLKPYIDYKGGNLVGTSYNSTIVATSAYVFMINSLLSPYTDVVHILPVKTLKAQELTQIIREVILRLEQLGFEVLVVVTNNNAINRKAMSLFAEPPTLSNQYKHPAHPSRPLFFAIDSVHIFKNLRNNWLNKPNQEMVYPDFNNETSLELNSHLLSRIANFESLKNMHSKECNQLLKYGYTLSLKALYPSSIERENVKLVLQIFNSNTVTALRELGPKINLKNYDDTATYIDIVSRWWDVVNVKTPFKGIRYRNSFQEPITKDSHHIFEFLNRVIRWLDTWDSCNGDSWDGGKLTKKTHQALRNTTEMYIKLSHYCLDKKNFQYILLGKIQTDKLEERFGKYRYQSGSQYHVSLRQIFETENKFRMMSFVPLILKSKAHGDIKITKEDMSILICEKEKLDEVKIPPELQNIACIQECDTENISDDIWPSLAYIGGYSSYALIKNLKCDYCKVFLLQQQDESRSDLSLITANDRGGLCYPSDDVVMSTAYTYLTIKKLLEKESSFLSQLDHRKILMSLTFDNINDLDVSLFLGHNCPYHRTEFIVKSILFRISNILLNNYAKKKNDVVATKTMPCVKRSKK